MQPGWRKSFDFVDHTGDVRHVALCADGQGGTDTLFRTGFGNITTGVIRLVQRYQVQDVGSVDLTIPSDPNVQNEVIWRVLFQDVVTLTYDFVTLPGADLTLLAPGSEVLDISTGPGLDFKDFFEEQFCTVNFNPLVVYQVQLG